MESRDSIASEFVRWAGNAPHLSALMDGQATLSRGEMLTWCRAGAGTLASLPQPPGGPGPALCALLVPRSWAVPMGLVAARMAGLAVVVLDVNAPTARLVAILSSARPALVLTFKDASQPALQSLDAEVVGSLAPPVQGLEHLQMWSLPNARRLPPGTGHMVYTSGSTGVPKGVLLADGPMLDTAAAQRRLLGLDRGGVSSPSIWTLNPAFDASLSDIFCALLGSAPLVVSRPEQTRWRSLAALARRHGASRADLAPSLMRLLKPDDLGLEATIFGGEPCEPATAVRWGGQILALQAYGPTEAGVCAMMARAGTGWTPGLLGRPLDHQVVLLATRQGTWRIMPTYPGAGPGDMAAFNATTPMPWDSQARAVHDRSGQGDMMPDCLVGEIHLAGASVALGYLDNPGAQETRFGCVDGVRVHYTGDSARWQGGLLVWTGRTDRQLKIHGRMVCPEEVEALAGALWGGPCACMPDGDGLVLVLGPRDRVDTHGGGGLLDAIEHNLGRVYRPSRCIEVRHWPLNANAKTDLAALARSAGIGVP